MRIRAGHSFVELEIAVENKTGALDLHRALPAVLDGLAGMAAPRMVLALGIAIMPVQQCGQVPLSGQFTFLARRGNVPRPARQPAIVFLKDRLQLLQPVAAAEAARIAAMPRAKSRRRARRLAQQARRSPSPASRKAPRASPKCCVRQKADFRYCASTDSDTECRRAKAPREKSSARRDKNAGGMMVVHRPSAIGDDVVKMAPGPHVILGEDMVCRHNGDFPACPAASRSTPAPSRRPGPVPARGS